MQEITTYSFTGDIVTYIGFIGVLSTAVIVTTSFVKWFRSPVNK
jgi:hypothetical protein